MRKKKKSLFDRMTAGVGVLLFIMTGAVDSESWIPLALCALCALWLALSIHVYNTKQARREARK